MSGHDDLLRELSAALGAEAAAALDRSAEIDLLANDEPALLARLRPLESAIGPELVSRYEESLRAKVRERTSARARELAERAERGESWVSTKDVVAVLREQSDAIDRMDPTLRGDLVSELSKHDLEALPDGDLAKELGRALGLLS